VALGTAKDRRARADPSLRFGMTPTKEAPARRFTRRTGKGAGATGLLRRDGEVFELGALLGDVEGERLSGRGGAGVLHVVHFAG